LEQAYGVELFRREGRQVTPTDAARRLYEEADEILNRLDSTFSVVAENPQQSLRLVSGVRMMLEDLAEPLAEFRKRFGSTLVLRQGNEQRAEELILADEVDLALALEPGPKKSSPRIHYEPAYTVEFLAIAKKNHPFMKSRRHSLRDLAEHDLIASVEGTHGRDALDQALHREELAANIVAETDNSAFTIACAAAGMGVGILAGQPTGRLSKQLATVSLSKQLGRRKIVLMWRKGRLLSEPMLELIDLIKSEHGQ
ncbi:MAG: LysR substrate-binding domain-containing protein, partial [Planctomycetota bacterium]